ncbi:MAG: hypothetical protein WBE58_10605, partial [Verrucomicrobiales bacterium]
DDLGTPTQKFFGSLALPALGIIALGGTIFSVVMGIRFAIAHRAFVAEGYPKQTSQLEKQPGESGGGGRISPATPPTPPGMRLRTGRFQTD